MTKRKFTASLVFALVLVMLMAAAGVAAVTGGYVGWDGIYHPFEESSNIEPPEQTNEQYTDLLAAVPDGEYWEITKNGNMMNVTANSHQTYEWDDFIAMIEKTKLPVPVIPDGYSFFSASFMTERETVPYSKSTLEDGAVLAKYKTKAPVAGEVTHYTLTFCKSNGGNLHSINAQIVPAQDQLIGDGPVAYLQGGEAVEAIEVEGFDYAICMSDPMGFTQLHMLQPMGDEMLLVDIMAFDDLPKEALLNLFPAE